MTYDEEIQKLTEQLAAIEHDRWSRWQAFMHGKCSKNSDGSLTIPAELVEKWERQINTVYGALTEREKESDREQVRKYLPLLKAFAAKCSPLGHRAS